MIGYCKHIVASTSLKQCFSYWLMSLSGRKNMFLLHSNNTGHA